MLFQFFFGMPIRFIHRLRCFAQVMEVAQLVRDVRQRRLYCLADGVLPIRDDPTDGNINLLLDLAKEVGKVRFTGTEETPGEEDF